MKNLFILVSGTAIFLIQTLYSQAAAFTPGNLVVLRAGDGVTGLSANAAACYLEEYTVGGTLVQTIPMPTAVGGGNNALTLGGSSTLEGFLQLSGNGQMITLTGYNATPGTSGPGGQTMAAVNRVVGMVSLNGTVDTSTLLTNGMNQSLRSAFTDNGSRFWISGAGGVSYVGAAGRPTSVTLMNSTLVDRAAHSFGGQLYVSSASGSSFGVNKVGTGMPTTAGQTATLLPGFPTTTGPSPYDYFLSGNDLWVADDRTTGSGGLQHWLFNGSSWNLQYTISRSSTVGVRGVSADLSGAAPLFYVTTTDNSVDLIVDNGTLASSTDTALFNDGTANTAFRGVLYLTAIPEPTTLSLVGGFGLLLLFLRRKK